MSGAERVGTPRHAERAWADFVQWCCGRGLKSLPAHPWTVAVFARWCEPRLPIAQIARNVRTIARVHLLAGYPVPDRHPTVRRTLRSIEARQDARRQGAALFRAEDFTASDDPKRANRRDSGKASHRARRTMRSRPNLVSRRPPRT
ncbi:MAG: hypothetical protein RBS99_11640 [Rhodospirillales bacterium]|nr:hypothetical protein [Rhodospirillales bacterium]